MKKKILSIIMSVIMLLPAFTLGTYAEGGLAFSLTSSVGAGEKLELGDTVTYTVKLTANQSGVSFGTLYFAPSDNLTYVSATLLGNDINAIKATEGDNAGSYGLLLYGDLIKDTKDDFCSVTFKVTERGTAEVKFYAYQLNNGTEFITPTIENGTAVNEITPPSAPVIETKTLNEGMVEVEYTQKLVGTYGELVTFSVEGKLPAGMTFSSDGTLSGTPAEFGEFPLTFKATLLNDLVSEPKTLTLTILEKPKNLELNENAAYTITENGYLIGVKEKTNIKALLSNFKNPENIKIYDLKGNEPASETVFIGTGFTVSLVNRGEAVHTVTVVVKGDVSGNGQVDPIDFQRVRKYLEGKYTFEGAVLEAAKVSGKNTVTPIDYQRIRLHINGNYNIYE